MKIGIIGFGQMGSSIAERLKSGYQIAVYDQDKNKTKNSKNITVKNSNIDLVKDAEVIILAIKPQDFESVLSEIKDYVRDKLVISIAAGITTRFIEERLIDARVIRTMPNIGVRTGDAVTLLCKGSFINEQDMNLAKDLFNLLGVTKEIDESLIDAATAISASGPAYFLYEIEKKNINYQGITESARQNGIQNLIKAAELVGFNPSDAEFLASQSIISIIEVLKKTAISAAELRRMISSKGGTTEAAISILEKGGTWQEAAQAAVKRAKELSIK